VAQDRVNEKSFVEALGGTPRRGWRWTAPRSRPRRGEIGTPGILKTRRDGYDGKGQWRIMTRRRRR
jgi:5-(carboxyamino)imidazole ribonucleotide synthase